MHHDAMHLDAVSASQLGEARGQALRRQLDDAGLPRPTTMDGAIAYCGPYALHIADPGLRHLYVIAAAAVFVR